MIRPYIVALAVLLGSHPTLAQEDPMAMQRCIWSCLAGPGNGDATNPAYHACVDQRCNETARALAPAPPKTDPTRVWQMGRDAQGTSYAGIDFPGYAGRAGVYFFCGAGQLRFAVIGLDGGPSPMFLTIDGQVYSAAFSANGPSGWPELPIFRGSPFLEALQAGRRASLADRDGVTKFTLSLTGSRQALGGLAANCPSF